MYPHAPHYWHRHFYRGPSRLLWFALGAVTASIWAKEKERAEWSGKLRHCIRAPIPQPALSTQTEPVEPWSARGVSRAVNSIPPAEMSSDDQKRLAELRASAGDKLAELSEATLDTVLTTVEVLKAKLAEHRAERDRQLEEERRQNENPPRLV
ncbi:hypothetical protein C0991_008956 [Blastosporella zonata]|nr:hypothetical protein C0991_008956 [Blastosporella zonata]